MFEKNKFDINPSRKDELGLDPFGLRGCTPVAQRPFEEAIQKTCLNTDDVDFSKLDLKDVPDGEVPPRLFFIWFGSAFDQGQEKFQKIMAEWRKLNPHHAVVIFTDQIDKNTHANLKTNSTAYQNMLAFAKENNICIVNHAEFMTSTAPLEMSLLEKNYGKASDVFRLDLLLDGSPGIYADIDVAGMKLLSLIKLAKGFALNKSGVKATSLAAESFKNMNKFSNDYLMMAAGDHEGRAILREIRQQLLKNMTMGWKTLFEELYKVAPNLFQDDKETFTRYYWEQAIELRVRLRTTFEEWKKTNDAEITKQFSQHQATSYHYEIAFRENRFHQIDPRTLKKVTTEVISGPQLVIPFRDRCDDVGTYASSFTASWLQHYTPLKKDTDDENIKRIITIILFDLTQDPTSLRLDRFSSEFAKTHIRQTVLRLLKTHFGQHLQKVTHVVLPDTLQDRLENVYRLRQTFLTVRNMFNELNLKPTLLFSTTDHNDAITEWTKIPCKGLFNHRWDQPEFRYSQLLPNVRESEEEMVEFYKELCEARGLSPNIPVFKENLTYMVCKEGLSTFAEGGFSLWLARFISLEDKNHRKKLAESFWENNFDIKNIDNICEAFEQVKVSEENLTLLMKESEQRDFEPIPYLSTFKRTFATIMLQLSEAGISPEKDTFCLVVDSLLNSLSNPKQVLTMEQMKNLTLLRTILFETRNEALKLMTTSMSEDNFKEAFIMLSTSIQHKLEKNNIHLNPMTADSLRRYKAYQDKSETHANVFKAFWAKDFGICTLICSECHVPLSYSGKQVVLDRINKQLRPKQGLGGTPGM